MRAERPNHRRRVVLVTNGLVRAGSETQTLRLAAYLKAHGDDVRLLSIMPTAAFADELAELEIPVAHVRLVPRLRALSSMLSGWRILRTWQPHVLISFVYQSNVLGRVAGALAGVPVRISSVRNERISSRGRELVYRSTDFLATATTTNSERVAAHLVGRRIVPADRLFVIPNSDDPGPIDAAAPERGAARRELGVGDGDFLWLAAGRLHPQKDYSTLLTAFAQLIAGHPTARLRIAGEGHLGAELSALVEQLGLQDRVHFLGLRTDVPRLLAAADSLVLASAWEGLPNIVIEAMTAGLPVVATTVGGVPELVEAGRTGFLVPPRDPSALARAMACMMALAPEFRDQMRARARAAVADRFSVARIGQQWLDLLDACSVGRPPSPRPVTRG